MKYVAIDIESWDLMVRLPHMVASHKRGNPACREYRQHATSGEEKYQKSHGHNGTT